MEARLCCISWRLRRSDRSSDESSVRPSQQYAQTETSANRCVSRDSGARTRTVIRKQERLYRDKKDYEASCIRYSRLADYQADSRHRELTMDK
jgi:hypothetical protein